MPKLKYVGLKKGPLGETAFREETGISWFPGTVKDVPAAIAARMLNHPDVFELAAIDREDDGDASAPLEAAPPAPAAAVVVPLQDAHEEDESLTPAQQRMAAFASGDTGNEDEFAVSAGDPLADQVTETATAEVDTDGMTLAPGGTVAQAPEQPPEPQAPAAKAKAKTRGGK